MLYALRVMQRSVLRPYQDIYNIMEFGIRSEFPRILLCFLEKME